MIPEDYAVGARTFHSLSYLYFLNGYKIVIQFLTKKEKKFAKINWRYLSFVPRF